MKQHILNKFTLSAAACMMLAGCATQRDGKTVTSSPRPCVLTTDSDGNALLDVDFHVPAHYVSKRSRIVITPQLMNGDTVVGQCRPVALYSPIYNKKTERLKVLYNYTDTLDGHITRLKRTSQPADIPYAETISMPAGVDSARIVAVVSTDGCGECSGIDTIEVGRILPPAFELDLTWIEPIFKIHPKVVEGKGEARLQFVINKHDINLSMGNNRAELDSMVAKLGPVLSDSLATLTSLSIFGMASADGPLSFNTPLALNRANAAKQWLIDRLDIKPAVQKVIRTGSRPEGWQPVLDAMTADHHPDAAKVGDIMNRYASENDDVAERFIRRLACWKDIREKYLQKDRKVEYYYTYTIRSFTRDDEMLRMYKVRPDAFNVDELLHVAALAPNDEERIKVYRYIRERFPESAIAANNLAVLYLRKGMKKEAEQCVMDWESRSYNANLEKMAAERLRKAARELKNGKKWRSR